MRTLRRLLTAAMMVVCGGVLLARDVAPRPDCKTAMASLVVPRPWVAETPLRYDTSKGWKLARLEIRRRLGKGDLQSRREAMALTWAYHTKGDIGDGHELPMYLYLGGEIAWAIKAHHDFHRKLLAEGKPGIAHSCLNLASCYAHFGEYDRAIEAVELSLEHLPKQPWGDNHRAHALDMLGDLYAAKGDRETALDYYARSAELYPQLKIPYGRHNLPIRAAKVRAKAAMLGAPGFAEAGLRNGVFRGQSIGYVDRIRAVVKVADGRVADIQLTHKENIPLGAEALTPERIIDGQTLAVDGVTGATTTVDAIRHAVYDALGKAGRPN